jgi:hypothetical protein
VENPQHGSLIRGKFCRALYTLSKTKIKRRNLKMEELKKQLISIGITALTAILTAVGAFLISKVKGTKVKILEPLRKMLDDALENEYLLPILRNVFQTFTKDLKANGGWSKEAATESIQKAYDSLIKVLPKYLIDIAKKIFPDVETSLKEKIQIFYEKHKTEINQIIVKQEEQL